MEVKDYMSTNVITVTPETTVMKALDLMKEHDIHRLPSCGRWEISRTVNRRTCCRAFTFKWRQAYRCMS